MSNTTVNTTTPKPDMSKSARTLILTSVCFTVLVIMWLRSQLDFRAGHMDEYDYLFVAKTLLAGQTWPTQSYIFGSDLSWYLYGWGEAFIGGLTGARSVAALFGMISLVGLYLFSKEVWQSKRIALVATLLLATTANHIFISRLATYDALSFMFFSLAMMPLLRSCQLKHLPPTRFSYIYLLSGSILLLAAVLSKYTTAAYLPFVGLFMLIAAPLRATIAGTIIALGMAVYASMHWDQLLVLYQIQINGIHGANTTYIDIVLRSVSYIGIPLILTVLAVYWENSRGDSKAIVKRLLLILLFTTPLFLYHLQGKNLISLYKHLNFSLFFLVCGAAWFLVTIYDHYRLSLSSRAATIRYAPAVLSALLISYTLLNFHQLKNMESGYPNMQGLINHIQQQDFQSTPRILSEDPYLFRYLAFDSVPQDQIKETSWLDNDKDGVHSHQDVQDALWDKKYTTVLLTDAIHPKKNSVYRDILFQRGYIKQYEERYVLTAVMSTHTTGKISLYQLPSATAQTSQ